MSVKIRHETEWIESAGQKIRYGNQWRTLAGSDRLFFGGQWHYLGFAHELYWRETYGEFVQVGNRADWCDVLAFGGHCCVALTVSGSAYAIEADGGHMVKLADGIARITNRALIRTDGRFMTYSVFFQRDTVPQVYVSDVSVRSDLIPDGFWAVSAAGTLLQRVSGGDYTYQYGDRATWTSVQCGAWSPQVIPPTCFGVAIGGGKVAIVTAGGSGWIDCPAPVNFAYVAKIHIAAAIGSRILALTDTGDMYSVNDFGVPKINNSGAAWVATAAGGGAYSYAINAAGELYSYDNAGLRMIAAGGLFFDAVAAYGQNIFGIVRVTR